MSFYKWRVVFNHFYTFIELIEPEARNTLINFFLGIKYGTKQLNPNESQEIMIDFDTTQSDSFDLNNSFDMSHINKRMPNLKSKDKTGDALIRSSEDRSMDEMSLHDQIIKQNSKVNFLDF